MSNPNKPYTVLAPRGITTSIAARRTAASLLDRIARGRSIVADGTKVAEGNSSNQIRALLYFPQSNSIISFPKRNRAGSP